ncbi:MAG: 4,5-dioxygenase [Alphaproteobacteria bacterium]|nr:4,5-dioxygenase [Alphaproteobacteria bacterium]
MRATPPAIAGYHIHVYFDAATREPAARLREAVAKDFPAAQIGRWHEQPVGPHPMWSYQVAFAPELFGAIVPWMLLHREGLTVLVHPRTGDEIADHRDYPFWLGEAKTLDLAKLG